MKKISVIILLILPSVYVTNAQQLKDTISLKYPSEIQITAPRMNAPLSEIPFATSIVGPYILDEQPRTISFDEALKLVPGVKIDNQSDAERVHLSIRGQGILTERGTRGINLLIDGIPMNDPTGFVPDFFNIDFNNVEKIEVLRGSAAALFGGSASGGIISVTTQSAPHVPLFGEVFGTGGSNGFWKADRKSTRLNSSHLGISYAVFCLKKKKLLLRSDRKSTRLNSSHLCIWYAAFCLLEKPLACCAALPSSLAVVCCILPATSLKA